MDMKDVGNLLTEQMLSARDRAIRLEWGGEGGPELGDVLMPQHIAIDEGINEGVTAHVTCLTTRVDRPWTHFLGRPMEVQVVTDEGRLRTFSVITTDVRPGQSDGGFCVVQLCGRDVLAVMDRRVSSRVFMNKSVLQVVETVLSGWIKRFPILGVRFEFRFLGIDLDRYPQRDFTFQVNESDGAFVRRLLRQAGISWVIQPKEEPDRPQDSVPVAHQTMWIFDEGAQLPRNEQPTLRYHRRDNVGSRDAVSLLVPAFRLTEGGVVSRSFEHETATVSEASCTTVLDQGPFGSEFAAALIDARIDKPRRADDWVDHQRMAKLDMQRHEMQAQQLNGVSSMRTLTAGQWGRVEGHPQFDDKPDAEREIIILRVCHEAENNLPKEIGEQARSLVRAAEDGIEAWRRQSPGGRHPSPSAAEGRPADGPHRYVNRFVAVPRAAPIAPAWNPATDQPRMPLMTAVVTGPPNEPVYCDELGRVKVRFLGLDPEDHVHASGAGTNDRGADSAWIRVAFTWAGQGYGQITPLRGGMEVDIQFVMGDPDRPVITGTRYNAANPPARFSNVGALPDNRYLSGTVSREVRGERYNQIRLDDTPGQISAQLASEHAHSQLNLGWLTHPRCIDGAAAPRGEGFELRSDGAGAIRTAKMVLMAAWARRGATGNQLDSQEHQSLLDDALALLDNLGQYAGQHQGLPTSTQGQSKLGSDVKGGSDGSNVNPKAAGEGAPTLNLSAQAGIAATTPKTILHYAGVDINTVARQHLQFAAGGNYAVNASLGVSLFAQRGGARVIANQGPLLMQSQNDDTRIESAKSLTLSAVGGRLLGQAQDEILLVTKGGAYLRLSGGDVEIGGPGTLHEKSSKYRHDGPNSGSANMHVDSAVPPPPYDEQFIVKDEQTGHPAAYLPYVITDANGQVLLQGITDEEGRASRVHATGAKEIRIFY